MNLCRCVYYRKKKKIKLQKNINFLEIEINREQTKQGVIQKDFSIGCREGSVKLKIIKPEGKNIMSGEEFLRGRPHLVNTSLS